MSNLEFDVDTVVISVNKAEDGTTRNHALALLTSLGRLLPDAVLKHLIDILSVVGESTLTQVDILITILSTVPCFRSYDFAFWNDSF